jgi:thiol-disulfide isomerase/thioredoxin
VLVVAAVVVSCNRRPAPPGSGQHASGTAAAQIPLNAPLAFIEDDYERARGEAKRRNVPLFVDVWASWCHTCMSIKQYVLPEREQPGDYNAPARLARVYLSLGRVPEARAAIERAIVRSEGPRKLRLYMLKSDVLVAAHDAPGAKAALVEALRFAEQSRLPPQFDELKQAIERRVRDSS